MVVLSLFFYLYVLENASAKVVARKMTDKKHKDSCYCDKSNFMIQ